MDDAPGKPRGAEHEPAETQGQGARSQDRPGQGEDGSAGKRKAGRILHSPLFLIVAGAVIVALLVGGLLWWLHARRFVSTDDAYVDAHIVHVAPQVAGYVERVAVDDNAFVQPGQLLVEIEPTQIRAQYDQAVASRDEATAQADQARAQLKVDQAKLEQAQADARAAAAQAANAARDLDRYRSLHQLNPAAVSQQQLDQAATQASNTAAQLQAAQRQVKGAAAQRAADQTQVGAADARIRSAAAQIRSAGVNLGYTRIAAALAGSIAQRTVAVGSYVQPGQALMALVPHDVFVTANFKETQLKAIRPGQPVTVSVDSCGGVTLHGRVNSIQRGAGQAFAVLPPENATGNFVKVVQRVPVKIVLTDLPRYCVLGPGMSVVPKVQVR